MKLPKFVTICEVGPRDGFQPEKALITTANKVDIINNVALSGDMVQSFPNVKWLLHMHDTRGMALPNILAAMQAGVGRFDASFSGLGGCPYAPEDFPRIGVVLCAVACVVYTLCAITYWRWLGLF